MRIQGNLPLLIDLLFSYVFDLQLTIHIIVIINELDFPYVDCQYAMPHQFNNFVSEIQIPFDIFSLNEANVKMKDNK